MPLYKKLGPWKYLCPVCGSIFEGGTSRWDAQNCCKDSKGSQLTIQAIEQELQHYHELHKPQFHPHHHHDADPAAGIRKPTRDGHWYRGHNLKKKTLADYSRAQRELVRQDADARWDNFRNQAAGESELDRLYSGLSLRPLAFAFHCQNWQQVKQAALRLARCYAALAQRRVFYNGKEILADLDAILDGDADIPQNPGLKPDSDIDRLLKEVDDDPPDITEDNPDDSPQP